MCCTGRNPGRICLKRCWVTYGLDKTFLVQLGVADHSDHDAAVVLRDGLIADGHDSALVPQVTDVPANGDHLQFKQPNRPTGTGSGPPAPRARG